jgi:hypothetical protein
MIINHYFLFEYTKELSTKDHFIWVKENQIEVANCTGFLGIRNWLYYRARGYTKDINTINSIREKICSGKSLLHGKDYTSFKEKFLHIQNPPPPPPICPIYLKNKTFSTDTECPRHDSSKILFPKDIEEVFSKEKLEKLAQEKINFIAFLYMLLPKQVP